MSGRHPWNTLLERTFSPEERTEIAREGAKIAADNRRRRNPPASRSSSPQPQPRPRRPAAERASLSPNRSDRA